MQHPPSIAFDEYYVSWYAWCVPKSNLRLLLSCSIASFWRTAYIPAHLATPLRHLMSVHWLCSSRSFCLWTWFVCDIFKCFKYFFQSPTAELYCARCTDGFKCYSAKSTYCISLYFWLLATSVVLHRSIFAYYIFCHFPSIYTRISEGCIWNFIAAALLHVRISRFTLSVCHCYWHHWYIDIQIIAFVVLLLQARVPHFESFLVVVGTIGISRFIITLRGHVELSSNSWTTVYSGCCISEDLYVTLSARVLSALSSVFVISS